jgi:putative ABC transport system permease protein
MVEVMRVQSTVMIARAEVSGRLGSLLGLVALVAVVTTAVLAAAVGAHRSATAVDRFRAWSHANDVEYQTNGPTEAEPMLAAAQADAAVDTAGLRHLVNVWPDDGSADIAVMSDPDNVYATRIDRPRLLKGRMPSPDSPDEVMLNELAAQVTGLGLGDHIAAKSWNSNDLEALGGGSFPGFNGPHVDLVVVGIGRTADELSGTLRRTSPYAIGSAAFINAHPGIGAWPPSVDVRLRDGASHRRLDDTMSRIQAQALSIDEPPPDGFHTSFTTAGAVYLDTMRTTTDSLVVGLALFAVAAALAGGLAVGQAVARQLAGSVTSSTTLAALGLTRSQIARARSLPIALGAGVGVAVGVAGAIAASPLLPIGLVRRAEIDRGIWIDPMVLTLGAVVVVGSVSLWAFVTAHRQTRRPTPFASQRRAPLTAQIAARLDRSPSLATGVRMAGDRGRGRDAVPVRSAFVAVAIAVTGLLAAGVVAASYDELSHTPSRWGVPWSSTPDYFGDQSGDALLTQLAGDRRIDAVGDYASGNLLLDGQAVPGSSLRMLRGAMRFTRVAGRWPHSPTEVALGAATAADLKVTVGDTVTGARQVGDPVVLTVVGTVVLPADGGEYGTDKGAALTAAGLRQLSIGNVDDTPVLRFPAGADVGATERGLARDYGLDFNLFTEPRPEGAISSLADPRDIGIALAGFLAVLATIGMVHALVVSTRRRRHDLGILRALGLRGRETTRAVIVAALFLAAAGLVVGIPAGVVVGRAVWRDLVASSGAVSSPLLPWVLVAAVVPAVALITLMVSWLPARRVRSKSPAASLRVE